MDKVQTFFAGEIAKFLNRLKSTPEGNGNMLDNSLVFFFTDFSDAADHSHDRIPTFTFGRAGGKVTPGRTVPYAEDKGHGHLLWGILNAFDIGAKTLRGWLRLESASLAKTPRAPGKS